MTLAKGSKRRACTIGRGAQVVGLFMVLASAHASDLSRDAGHAPEQVASHRSSHEVNPSFDPTTCVPEWASKRPSQETAAGPIAVKHNEVVLIGAAAWQAHGASKPYSTVVYGPHARFEIRKGDRAPFDSARQERSELCGLVRFHAGQRFTASLSFMVEPGPVTRRQWLIPFQVHQDDPSSAPAGTPLNQSIGSSPLMAVNIVASANGESLQITGETSSAVPLLTFPPRRIFAEVPFQRGVQHSLMVELIDDNGGTARSSQNERERRRADDLGDGTGSGTGMLRVTYNGTVIVDREQIPVGYAYASGQNGGKGSYPKFGLYAEASGPTEEGAPVVVHVWNPRITLGP